jgi:tetratricopeptide (TPR) repeat protein
MGHYCLAFSFHRCGESQDALLHYDKALEAGFDEFWIRYNRGVIFAKLGAKTKAKAELSRASELDPAHDGPRSHSRRLADQ